MSIAPNAPIGVLVVDDSPFMRLTIQKIISQDPGIKVLDTARDGREGIEKLKALRPQVVTMDVEMPVLNGLQALDEIMRWQPTPVIVLSSLTTQGAEATLKAFDLGAFEVVAKPSGGPGADLQALARELVDKIKAAAGVNMARLGRKSPYGIAAGGTQAAASASGLREQARTGSGVGLMHGNTSGVTTPFTPGVKGASGSNFAGSSKQVETGAAAGGTGQNSSSSHSAGRGNTPAGTGGGGEIGAQRQTHGLVCPKHRVEIVAIGTSTGGPSALQAVLPHLPAMFPVPVIVAQHMPPGFTGPLAQRLNGICSLEVREGVNNEVLKAGTIYIAPAGKQMQVQKRSGQMVLHIGDESPISTLYHPSVDVMFLSLAKEVGRGTLGVVMTGMGNDGLRGMKEIKALEGFAIAEAEETCVVYGMPRALVDAGLADRVVPLGEIGRTIVECVQRR